MMNACKTNQHEHHLGVIYAFCEVVNAGVKPLALSEPMTPSDIETILERAKDIANKHDCNLYRETELLENDLFPGARLDGKEILLIYQGNTLEVYKKIKADKTKLEERGEYSESARREISKRFGRLLGYSPKKINQLLSLNTDFRTLSNFGIRASNLFLYYKDLSQASNFYSNILGMEIVADYGMATILRLAKSSYLILVDEKYGMHNSSEAKTVAIALLTNQLAEWNAYLKTQNVQIKYGYHPKEGGAHDGFVIVDPEGYLLEFETFKQHPENEFFLPVLNQNPTITGSKHEKRLTPEGLGFHSTITWLYYKDLLSMQHFLQDVLGLEIVADQGWAKIYQVTPSGFLGLVDEMRGMHSYTKEKAVTVSFIIDDIESWYEYAKSNHIFPLRSGDMEIGPESKYKAFVGYDPEGYFLEFDKFYKHPDNSLLLEYLNLEF